jgi:hypothetical protein
VSTVIIKEFIQVNKVCQVKNGQNEQNLWDEAIADTERKLSHVEARAKRLKAAIDSYKAHKKAGIPWPGEDAGTDKSIPA